MYLNLDLLYNIDNYLYPLFYYKSETHKEVYSPITKKSIVCFHCNKITIYYDYIILKKINLHNNTIYYFELDCFQFTEKNTTTYNIIDGYKCNPFYLDKEELEYLKSNTRINKN